MQSYKKMNEGTLKSYITGFVISIVLTLAAYFAVVDHLFYSWILIGAILALALAQFIVQVFFFLHIGAETGQRWKLGAFIFTIGLVLIIVIGSLWIMNHLNYAMMASPTLMNQYIQNQQGGF